MMMRRRAAAACCAAALFAIPGCSPAPPPLPDDSPTAVAEQITGSDGDAFLAEITTFDCSGNRLRRYPGEQFAGLFSVVRPE